MRHTILALLLLPSAFALENLPSSEPLPHPTILVVETPAPQPPAPYLELRDAELDRRQAAGVQPAAAGAPAAAAAAATKQPVAGAAAAPAAAAAAPAAPAAAAPAAPAAAAAGVVGAHGSVPVAVGPATAQATAPLPKTGSIGMGTLTGRIGVVKTAEAKSEAGLKVNNRLCSLPAAFKVGASVLLGTAVGIGVFL